MPVAFAEPRCCSAAFATVPSPSRHGLLNSFPHSEPAVQISCNGLPRACTRGASSYRWVEKLRFRELEPRPTLEVAPEHAGLLGANSRLNFSIRHFRVRSRRSASRLY